MGVGRYMTHLDQTIKCRKQIESNRLGMSNIDCQQCSQSLFRDIGTKVPSHSCVIYMMRQLMYGTLQFSSKTELIFSHFVL